MRIAFVTYYYLPHVGGGTWFPYHVCKGLAARGHTVTLFAPSMRFRLAAASEHSGGVTATPVERLNTVALPLWFAPFVGLLLFQPHVLRRLRESDVIIAQFHPHHSIALGAVVAAKLVDRPIAVRVEDTRRWMYGSRASWRTRIEYWLAGPSSYANEWAARRAGCIMLPTTAAMEGWFVNRRGSHASVLVTGNGVDTDVVASLPSRAELRRRLHLPDAAFIVVFAGRFAGGEYGLEYVLAAFKALRARRPDALLALVGDSLPAPLQDRYGDLVRSGALYTLGPRPQLESLSVTAAADVAIGPMYPTLAAPLKVVEAVALGTRVLSGEGSLGPDLQFPRSQVELVRASSDALGEALVRQAEMSPRVSGPRNPDTILPYSWRSIVDRVEAALAQLVRAGGPRRVSPGV